MSVSGRATGSASFWDSAASCWSSPLGRSTAGRSSPPSHSGSSGFSVWRAEPCTSVAGAAGCPAPRDGGAARRRRGPGATRDAVGRVAPGRLDDRGGGDGRVERRGGVDRRDGALLFHAEPRRGGPGRGELLPGAGCRGGPRLVAAG